LVFLLAGPRQLIKLVSIGVQAGNKLVFASLLRLLAMALGLKASHP
jgi:hypothetical protein